MDAVQSFGKLPLTFKGEDGPDCITISGHKIHGFKGSGVLAFRKPMQWNLCFWWWRCIGLRSGTVAVPQAVALAKAADMQLKQWMNVLKTTVIGNSNYVQH
ncbi:Aminotransferase class V OS=Lysinibacillus sphaericus OX=1421 GN=LS41612_06300 PE=4 SV=1 [Lysinibacillus sphaericus]